MQAASEESKSSEILKRDKIIETLSAECAAAKSAAQNEHAKNLLLQKQLDDSLREITMLQSKRIMIAEAEKENSNLKVSYFLCSSYFIIKRFVPLVKVTAL